MARICFLILHYKSYADTMRCVDSISALEKSTQCQILVLDNGSCNGSFEQLTARYGADSRIQLFKWEQGRGFSGGNNFLYQEAKRWSPDFLVVANNDILFSQHDFCTRLESLYIENPFDILGPDIYVPEKKLHQNPMMPYFPSIAYLEAEVNAQKQIRRHIYRYVFKEWLVAAERRVTNYLPKTFQELYNKGRHHLKPARQVDFPQKDYKNTQDGCVLCGACLIVSSDFIKKNQKLFDPVTDFYYEEYLLGLRCKKAHMIMRYSPQLKVEHNHESSTRQAYKGMLERRVFITDNMIKSGELLLSVLKEDKNIWNKNL